MLFRSVRDCGQRLNSATPICTKIGYCIRRRRPDKPLNDSLTLAPFLIPLHSTTASAAWAKDTLRACIVKVFRFKKRSVRQPYNIATPPLCRPVSISIKGSRGSARRYKEDLVMNRV